MQQQPEEDIMRSSKGNPDQEGKFIGEIILAAIILITICVAYSSVILAMVLYAGVVFGIKKNWILYALLPLALFGLLVLHGSHEWSSIFGFMSLVNFPYLSSFMEEKFNNGHSFELSRFSYISTFVYAVIITCVAHPFIAYYRSKIVKSKYKGLNKKREELKYRKFRLNRYKYLNKKQITYRKSNSIENFIGYDEFGNRVVLGAKEPNQHMFVAMTTGGGKTVIIATNIENALRQNKPIIFVDGKGDRESMLEFKALCEKNGRKVHLFTDMDQLSFNFLRHGSPTQLRDKVMNLFEWSEPFYKTNCSRFLQLIFKMLREFDQPIDLETIYQLTFKSKVASFLNKETEKCKTEIRINTIVDTTIALEKKPSQSLEDFWEKNAKKKENIDKKIVPNSDSLFSFDEDFTEVKSEEGHEVVQEPANEVVTESSSSMFEGLDEEKEVTEPEPQFRIDIDLDRKAKVDYYRERFFGDEEEEDEENSGLNFNTLTSLRNQIAELIESDLGHLFEENENGMDLMDITDNNEVAIFSISGNKYKDYIKTLGRVVIMEVNTLVDYRNKMGKKSILSVYDEFSAYVSHEVVDVINKSRSAGFECLISVQGLSDIDVIDPVLTRQIINNCNTYFVGRVNEAQDADVLSAVLGTYEDNDITSQVEKKSFKQRFESEMGTVRTVQRFRAHPDDIKNLSTGEVFLCRKVANTDGKPYVARVYVRNALDLTGISA